MNEFLTWNHAHFIEQPSVIAWVAFGFGMIGGLFLFYYALTGLVDWVIRRFFTATGDEVE